MARCEARRADGAPCGGKASGLGRFCPRHRDKTPAIRDEGPRAVPRAYHAVFAEFLESPEPYNLKGELAALRSLYVEARDVLEGRCAERREACVQDVKEALEAMAGEVGISEIGDAMREALAVRYPSMARDLDDCKLLAGMLESVCKCAERMKRIQEGVRMEVSLDAETLMGWLRFVVFPFVSDPDVRGRMVQRAAAYPLASRNGQHGDHARAHEEEVA